MNGSILGCGDVSPFSNAAFFGSASSFKKRLSVDLSQNVRAKLAMIK
jgi:hypothetical protein